MLALADYAKMNFGGILPSGNESSHGVDMPPLRSHVVLKDHAGATLEDRRFVELGSSRVIKGEKLYCNKGRLPMFPI